jgi:hypothetical protein
MFRGMPPAPHHPQEAHRDRDPAGRGQRQRWRGADRRYRAPPCGPVDPGGARPAAPPARGWFPRRAAPTGFRRARPRSADLHPRHHRLARQLRPARPRRPPAPRRGADPRLPRRGHRLPPAAGCPLASPHPRGGHRYHRPPRSGPVESGHRPAPLGVHRLGSRRPGSRLWDVAYALHGFVLLSANPRYQRPNPAHRMRLFADAYGLDQAQRQELVPMLARRARAMHDFPAGHPALNQAVASRPRPRLASRQRLHRHAGRRLAAGPPWLTRS